MQIKDIVKKVKQIEIRSKKNSEQTLMGQYHSAFKGQGMTFSEVRPYQFGDEIRRIDWNKTARFKEPFVKVMEEERELVLMILVDISASMNYGTHQQLKREFVAEIVASLGFSAVGNLDRVGLILYADQIYKVIPPAKGRKHILSIISQILSADYIPTNASFDVALDYILRVFKRKIMCFALSDFEDSFEEKKLKIASKKHQLLAIRIYDSKEYEIPNIGYSLFTDTETGKQIWVNTSNKRFRYEYVESRIKKNKQLQESFENASAGFLNLLCGEDYARILYKYFQKK